MPARFGSRRAWAGLVTGCAALSLIAIPASGAPAGGPSSPLATAHKVGLHLHLSSEPDTIVATEGPDGAVFFAKGSTVYVVDGDSEPARSESVGHKVIALAASRHSLYVQTRSSVIAYSRSTGTKTTSWPVADTGEFSPNLVAVNDDIWSLTSPATDQSGLEPATLRLLRAGHSPQTITGNANPGDLSVDPHGDAFYLLLSGRLGRTTPGDVTLHSHTKNYDDAELAYADGTLLVETDGARTTDTLVNPRSLAVESSHRGHLGDYFGLIQTTDGLLHLDLDCSHNATCSEVRVRRINLPDTANGSLKIKFGSALLGPKPVVIAAPAGRDATLYRLS
jgi:hypothetical protein